MLDRLQGKAEIGRVETLAQFCSEAREFLAGTCFASGLEANGCQLSEAAGPQLLGGPQAHEGFGRRPVAVPILLVPRADQSQVHREGRIPIRDPRPVRHALVSRGVVAVQRGSLHANHPSKAEAVRGRLQLAARTHHEVGQVDRVARTGLQVVRRPLVEQDFAIAEPRSLRAVGKEQCVGVGLQRRHGGIRDAPAACL